jgi:rfaE bifunctional protein kinase chain/domain
MATQEAKNKDILIAVDPKFSNFMNYKDVSVFKPNLKETEEALALKIENDLDLEKAGKRLSELLMAECVLITKGAAGMSLFESNGQVTHVSTKAREIVDVSGAGDTVISTMTTALVGGGNFKEAATLANYAAGIVCEEVGIIPINLDKLYKVCVGENIQ